LYSIDFTAIQTLCKGETPFPLYLVVKAFPISHFNTLTGGIRMKAVVYARGNANPDIYTQYNECARCAKRYGYSVHSRVLDFSGTEFHKAVDKVTFNDDVSCLIVYDKKSIGDYETSLFYQIYLDKLGKKLMSVY
jgi:hypothetical protein